MALKTLEDANVQYMKWKIDLQGSFQEMFTHMKSRLPQHHERCCPLSDLSHAVHRAALGFVLSQQFIPWENDIP
jgi:hypothetical protein